MRAMSTVKYKNYIIRIDFEIFDCSFDILTCTV